MKEIMPGMWEVPANFPRPKLKCAKCDAPVLWDQAHLHECKEQPIGPTPERVRQAADEVEMIPDPTNKNVNPAHKNTIRMMDGSPLDRMLSREDITAQQHAAGEQLAKDYERSRLTVGAMDMTRDVVDGGKADNASDQRAFYLKRYEEALYAIGEDNGHALIWLVIFGKKLEEYATWKWGYRRLRDARVASLTALRLALDALDRHYHRGRKARTVASHAEDYRPEIAPSDS